jgi:hypothetical protein
MASFRLNLAQFSTNCTSLVSTFVIFEISVKQIAICLQYIVRRTSIDNKQLFLVFLFHFISLLRKLSKPLLIMQQHLGKPFLQYDVGPSWAGLCLTHVIQGWLCTWAVPMKLRPY